ncbi:MAG: ferritin-like domain-containing protein [Myxococcota bacterium]
MKNAPLIDALNRAIALEHAAGLQYQHQALVVRGLWRPVYAPRFAEASQESFGHAELFGQKVVALGGVPTLEVAVTKQSLVLEEMLEHALDVETKALDAYRQALELAGDDVALTTMLEDQIKAETDDVEELELLLSEIRSVVSRRDAALRSAS